MVARYPKVFENSPILDFLHRSAVPQKVFDLHLKLMINRLMNDVRNNQ